MNQIKSLYVLAKFKEGEFYEYVRKGRNNSITGYDSYDSAKRGYFQSKRIGESKGYNLKIMKADLLSFVEVK